MSKPPRKSPGIGHNGDLADPAAIRKALAVEILDQELADKLRERRKKHRKAAEGQTVNLAQLDALFRKRKDPITTILSDIKATMHYAGAIFAPLKKQFDLFIEGSASVENQHAAHQAGLFAGLNGESPKPPPNLAGEDIQLWMEGHALGAGSRNEAEKEAKAEEKADSDRLKAMAEALASEPGTVIDGTGKGDPVAQVRAQAAADFNSDNPGVAQPDWSDFPGTPEGWSPEQLKVFQDWFATVPDGVGVAIAHAGVALAFKRARDAAAPPPPAEGEGFEASQEELDAQAGRPKPQTSQVPDPKEVDDAAKKLVASGFADTKPKRRLPGQKN